MVTFQPPRIDSAPVAFVAAADAMPSTRRLARGMQNGHVCSGANDHVQILEALNSGARKVVLSEGGFSPTATITIPSSRFLEGSGAGVTTVTWADGTDQHAIQNSAEGDANIRIEGITFDFNGQNQAADRHGIRMQGVSSFWLHGCELLNAYHHNLVSVTPSAGVNHDWFVSECVSLNPGQGVGVDGDCFRVVDGFEMGTEPGGAVVNCTARGASHHGFHVGNGVVADNCRAYGAGTANYMLGTVGDNPGGILANCQGHDPQGVNVLFNAANSKVDGGRFDGSLGSGSDVIRIPAEAPDATVMGVEALNGARHGIHVTATGARITGARVHGSGTHGILIGADDCSVIGGESKDNSDAGVRLEGSECIVSGIRATGNGDFGVREASGDFNIITGNNLRGNTGGGVTTVGAGTVSANNL